MSTPASPERNEDTELQQKLKKRLLIAGSVVALALLALPLLNRSHDNEQVEMTEDRANVSSGKISGQRPLEIASVPALEAPEASFAEETSQTLPAEPAAASPSSATPGPTPAPSSTRPPAPSPDRPAMPAGPAPQTPPKVQPLPQQAATQAPAPRPLALKPASTAAITPLTQTAPQAKSPSPAPAKPSGSSVGYDVQLGLFSNLENADKLLKSLQQQGIAAHSETRVRLGPFTSRLEAEEAINKLRKLGYQPMLIPVNE